jgi:predicted aspartyl protease
LPTFTSSVADLVAAGPGLQISVGPSRELINAFTGLGARVASPHLVSALIDTGAHSTVLNPDVISHLGIKPVGVAAIVTPSTTAALTCNRYHINVYFSEDFVVENVFAIEAPMGGVPYQCLIGRDILRLATLIYAGQRNEFTLEF